MDNRKIQQQAVDCVKRNGNSVLMTALLHSGAIYCTYILLTLINAVLTGHSSSGISGIVRQNNISDMITAIIYGVGIFAYAWDGCFRGYCRDLYAGIANGIHTMLSYMRRGFAFLFVDILRSLYQVLWFMLIWFPLFYTELYVFLASEITLSDDILNDTEALYSVLYSALLTSPHIVWYAAASILCFLSAFIFSFYMSYRYRLAPYIILDPQWSVHAALSASKQMIRGYRLMLFRMDLRFLWYHILSFLPTAVSYVILYTMEISDQYWTYFQIVCYIWMIIIETLLYPKISTAYAGFAYERFIIVQPSAPAQSLLRDSFS